MFMRSIQTCMCIINPYFTVAIALELSQVDAPPSNQPGRRNLLPQPLVEAADLTCLILDCSECVVSSIDIDISLTKYSESC